MTRRTATTHSAARSSRRKKRASAKAAGTAACAHSATSTLMPVFADIADPAWAQEVRMVVAVTGRRLIPISEDSDLPPEAGSECRYIAYLVADHATEWESHPNLIVIRVDRLEPSLDAGGALQLAELIGADDRPSIAVSSAVGGAGASLFAAAMAHSLAQRDTPVVLVDTDPLSMGLDVTLGLENQPGWRTSDIPADVTWEKLRQNTPQLAPDLVVAADARAVESSGPGTDSAASGGTRGVPVIAASRISVLDDRQATATASESRDWLRRIRHAFKGSQHPAVVLDCGRTGAAGLKPDLHVLVAPLTVPGIVAARDLVSRAALREEGAPLVVMRDIPGSTTTMNLAATMLGEPPAGRIPAHRECLRAVETGEVSHWLRSNFRGGHPTATAVLEAHATARRESIDALLGAYAPARGGVR